MLANHGFESAFTSDIADPHDQQHVVERLVVSVEGKKTEGGTMKYPDSKSVNLMTHGLKSLAPADNVSHRPHAHRENHTLALFTLYFTHIDLTH